MERQKGNGSAERLGKEEMKTVRTWQMREGCLLPGAVVRAVRNRLRGRSVQAGLLPRAKRGSLVLQYPGSVLISTAPVAVEVQADSSGLGHLLGPCLGP